MASKEEMNFEERFKKLDANNILWIIGSDS